MLVQPIRRAKPMARFRKPAVIRGAAPVRIFEASSRWVTSRTWCSASIVQ
jgi:hypothetical protein